MVDQHKRDGVFLLGDKVKIRLIGLTPQLLFYFIRIIFINLVSPLYLPRLYKFYVRKLSGETGLCRVLFSYFSIWLSLHYFAYIVMNWETNPVFPNCVVSTTCCFMPPRCKMQNGSQTKLAFAKPVSLAKPGI